MLYQTVVAWKYCSIVVYCGVIAFEFGLQVLYILRGVGVSDLGSEIVFHQNVVGRSVHPSMCIDRCGDVSVRALAR